MGYAACLLTVRSRGEGDAVSLDLSSSGFGGGIAITGNIGEIDVEKASLGLGFTDLADTYRNILDSQTDMMLEVGWPAVVLLVSLANGYGVEGGMRAGLGAITVFVQKTMHEKGASDLILYDRMQNLLKNYNLTYTVGGEGKKIVL